MSDNKWNAIAYIISNGKYHTMGEWIQATYVALRGKGIAKHEAKKLISKRIRAYEARETCAIYN